MNRQYVICIKNENYKATLEIRKVYKVLENDRTPNGLIRIVDENGEDYLFPKYLFVPLSIPQEAETIFDKQL